MSKQKATSNGHHIISSATKGKAHTGRGSAFAFMRIDEITRGLNQLNL